MAKHRLTPEEQEKGVERALQSPRTPPQLKKGLKKRQEQLAGKSGTRSTSKRAAGRRPTSAKRGSSHSSK